MLRKVYGVDLGTSSVKIYSLSKDKKYREKNMVAIRNKRQIVAVRVEPALVKRLNDDISADLAFNFLSG